MPAQWTGELLCKMHINNIKHKELAKYLGYNPKYVSAVLNGKRSPKKAELIFTEALNSLINEKNQTF